MSKFDAWEIVTISRKLNRPHFLDYVKFFIKEFKIIHGDRCFEDDPALICGMGYFKNYPVFLIGNQKGSTSKETRLNNYGMSKPEGYRKALRIMKLAEKFKRPVLSFIDTPGAYPGIDAEERGQAYSISKNIYEMQQLKTPIITSIIGEAGSGGALAIAIADRILMLRYAIYSIISPEGCVSILCKKNQTTKEASHALKLTAKDLLQFKIIHKIVDEGKEGAHLNFKLSAQNLESTILKELEKILLIPIKKLVKLRQANLLKISKNLL